jgi:hypothetical protein
MHACTFPQVHEAADGADWRQPENRLSTIQFLHREMARGKKISPIFFVFGVFACLFKVDWLHATDKGVAADFLGHEFAMLVKKMPGSTKQARCNELSEYMLAYYEEHNVEDRLKELSPKTFEGGSATEPCKLSGSAAQIRALVKFGHLMAQKFLSDADPVESAVKVAAHHLNNCYQALAATSSPYSHAALFQSSKIFALQYYALFVRVGDGVAWRVMPKMHLFLELCSEGTEPQKFWCYRDEDFGGTMARQSKMKGMWKKLSAYSKHGLDMFRMKNPAPRITVHTT